MRNTNDNKSKTKSPSTKKRTVRKRKKTKIHFLSIMVAICLVGLVSLGIISMVNVFTKGIENENTSIINTLSLFDNEVTKSSTYLYTENDSTNRFILYTNLKKENKNKKVYDLKVYSENKSQEGKTQEDLELVVDNKQIKVGPTVIYKKGLSADESFTTDFVKAKNEKAEVKVIRENDLELVIEIKYEDKQNKLTTEEITMEKTRGIVKIKKTLNDGSMPREINLVKTYFKLPEGAKWNKLFEDYMAE